MKPKQQIFNFARVGLYGGKPISRDDLKRYKKKIRKRANVLTLQKEKPQTEVKACGFGEKML